MKPEKADLIKMQKLWDNASPATRKKAAEAIGLGGVTDIFNKGDEDGLTARVWYLLGTAGDKGMDLNFQKVLEKGRKEEAIKTAMASGKISPQELAICHVAGVSPDQYLKSKAALAKAGE
ncbi:hypothetical protein F4212_09045 [Candidatus Poribacteria bacterium]|nr:hypothetical protein [Candidatus Poribacteria bacterium]